MGGRSAVTSINAPKEAIGLPQSLRFLLAGGFAAFVNWVVRFPLSLVMPFAPAVALANIIGMVVGFVIYRRYVFPGSRREFSHQVRDFIIVNLLSMIVVVAVSVIFADHLLPMMGLAWHTEAIAHAIGIAAGAVSNFFGHRQFSFARH